MHFIQWLAGAVFSTALFVHGFLFIPQAIKIWRRKNADGVSLLTFAGFNVVQLSAAIHGYFVHDLILMFGTGFSLLTCGSVTFSVIYFNLYKCKF